MMIKNVLQETHLVGVRFLFFHKFKRVISIYSLLPTVFYENGTKGRAIRPVLLLQPKRTLVRIAKTEDQKVFRKTRIFQRIPDIQRL